ncbi:MAG: T9SS type A sorting domain-containing protein [Bacteroidia bacterium]
MKKYLFLLVFILCLNFVEGQTTFFKTIGNSSVDAISNYVEQTTDGGYIIVGTYYGFGPTLLGVGYVIKTNSAGDTTWTKVYGNTGMVLNSGKQTVDGGYILLGKLRNGGYDDIYVLKINSSGTIQWQKIIGGSNNEIGMCIKQTSDSGYIITGYGSSFSAGLNDAYIIKLDSIGNLQWQNIIGMDSETEGASIETNDGGFIALGSTSDSSNTSTFLMKFNNMGTLQWSKKYNESIINNTGISILKTFDNGYLFLGNRIDTSASFSEMITITKTDSLGNINWSRAYKGSFYNNAASIEKTPSGNYIITGTLTIPNPSAPAYKKLLYTLIDNTGNVIWSNSVGVTNPNSDFGTFANSTTDGGYIFTGYTDSPSLGGFIYFIKADSLGRSGCNDSLVTLTTAIFSPAISSPSTLSTSGAIISTPTIIENYGKDSIITYCSTVGINELPLNPQISVYPNPSSGQFNFSGIEKGNKMEVFDITGQLIYQAISSGDPETITISEKAKGIYFYRITKEIKLVQSGKICIE